MDKVIYIRRKTIYIFIIVLGKISLYNFDIKFEKYKL